MPITKLISGLPNQSMNQADFDAAAAKYMAELPPWATEANALEANVNAKEASTVAKAAEANTSAGNAATSAGQASTQRAAAQQAALDASGYATAAGGAASAASGFATAAQNSAIASANSAAALRATSATSVTLGLGNKTFVTQADKQLGAGTDVKCFSRADTSKKMYGTVSSYSGTSLVVTVDAFSGSGSVSDWDIQITGGVGAKGDKGDPGGVNAGNLTGLLAELKAADVVAAATTNVWAAVGNSGTLTGTTAITSFGTAPQAGAKFTLIAGAATPMTNGANLMLPGGVNYTTAVDDRIEIYAKSTTVMHVSIFKKDGTAVFGLQVIRVVEQLSGGSVVPSVNNDITQTRGLNTVIENTIPGATLTSNMVTIPPGTYDVDGSAPCLLGQHEAFLYNVTDSSYTKTGTSEYVAGSNAVSTRSKIAGRFTITSAKNFTIRHFTSAALSNGLGQGVAISGQVNIFAELKFTKVGQS